MSKVIDPSPEQIQVIEAGESQIVVIAAAGAGKTMVLVARYLRHVLREGIDPDKILTITFTRKAAAEMKGRIVTGLREAGAFDAAQIAETGPIQTIHALCEQLLRENAISAGVDAQFEILSESQSDRLQVEAVEEALATVDLDNPDAEALIANLTGKRPYRKIDSPYALLQQSIKEALDHLRSSGLTFQEVWETYHDTESFRARSRQTILDAQPESVLAGYLLQTGDDWRENLKQAWKASPKATPAWLRNALPGLPEEMAAESETCGVAQFALEAWSLLERKMEQLQKFDFSYLEDRTLRLIRSTPTVREELGQKFEIVMVDEAQDLNRKQYGLIEVLGLRRKLTVGDGQQSIYGFRHADLELFRSSHSDGAPRRLSRNFRADEGLLNFVDRVFGATWPDQYVPMQELKEFDLDILSEDNFKGVEFWEMPPGDIRASATYIRRLIEEGAEPGEICVLARSSASCQTIHEALIAEGVDSRIHGGSEKFYTRMEVRDLANILRALADPYNDFALLAALRSPAVEISVEGIFRLGLHTPVLDTMGETELSTEDRGKLDGFLKWFEPMREYADRLSAWEVLSRVFSDTPFLTGLARKESSRRQIENVRKLLVLASQDSHLGPLEFADQIREIQQLRHKEGDAEEVRDQQRVVRLMTIHKAKGLEFPIVVLPDTNQELQGRTQTILFDLQLRLMAAKFGASQGLLYRFLSDRKRDRELAEELRVLYVAMTRAEKRLCIGLFPATSKDTVSRRIRKIFGDPVPESIRVRKPIEMG